MSTEAEIQQDMCNLLPRPTGETRKLSERITLDDAQDIVTVDGFKFTGEWLSALLKPTRAGYWHRIHSTDNGTIVVDTRFEESPSV